MKKVELFEHNEIAYQKLCEDLKTKRCTTINHATGTGKSFIALKYMYENRDKRILYLAPTYPILEQLKDDYSKLGLTEEDLSIDTMIYKNLLMIDINQLIDKYDIIILDEYHRCGAIETYKKIKKLKNSLIKSIAEKKLIGLTATPIRYLDMERNMTDEIFDGNVSSVLSLSEAMLKGLLPIPNYIISKIACLREVERLKKKKKRMGASKERDEIECEIQKIEKRINNGDNEIKSLLRKNITEKDGKYIVFCNTIDELKKLKKSSSKWFESGEELKLFEVHSRIGKEENQKVLDDFNKSKSGINLLFCVDILNEGVHVDDIDGVFLFRRTTSPIIFFQQIGRALSFSGRKRNIKIFDFVHNFNNHAAIDSVFREFEEEFQRLIKENPEKREEYLEKINRFKILDETREIYRDIDRVSNDLDLEKIIKSRLEESIKVLLKNPDLSSIFKKNDTKRHYMYVAQNYKYVTNQQFQELLNSGMILPSGLSMTLEEREELLDGYDSIYEYERDGIEIISKQIYSFIDDNNRTPNYNSNDEQEKEVAKKYLELLAHLKPNIRNELVVKIWEQQIPVESYEKSILGLELDDSDVDNLINLANGYLKDKKILPEYLSVAMEKCYYCYNGPKIDALIDVIDSNDSIILENKTKDEDKRIQMLSKIEEKIALGLSLEELKEIGILDLIKSLSVKDKKYITSKFNQLKEKKILDIVKVKGYIDLEVICSNAKSMNKNIIEKLNEKIKKQYHNTEVLLDFIDYIEEHKELPQIEGDDKFSELVKNEDLKEVLQKLIKSDCFSIDTGVFDSIACMKKVLANQKSEMDIQLILLKYIDFFYTNNHRPLENSSNEEERILDAEYKQLCLPKIGDNRLRKLNSVFNSKKAIRGTIKQYIKNKSSVEQDGNEAR